LAPINGEQLGGNLGLEKLYGSLAALASVAGQGRVTDVIGFSDNSTVTGTTLYTIWTPKNGHSFVLLGFSITCSVRTAFGGSVHSQIQLFDGSTSNTAAVISGCRSTEGAGNSFSRSLDIPNGYRSKAADNSLKIGLPDTIGGGVLFVSGTVWGREVGRR
jgi:hypothetical protein